MAMFPLIEVAGGAFARGIMHVAPDVPSRAEYLSVALAGEPALA